MIEKYLEDLEQRIDADVEERLLAQWKDFCDGQFSEVIFSPRRTRVCPPAVEWPEVSVNEAIEDFEKMALQQLCGCSQGIADGSGAIMCVRANYGTGILSSIFGPEVFVMDKDLNTLPTTRPLSGGRQAVKHLLKKGVPDLRQAYGEQTLAMGEYFRKLFVKYPKISRFVSIYHPDLQGPMDLCELLLGSSLFVEVVDHSQMVKSFLDLITETYIQFMEEWNNLIPVRGNYTVHWSLLHKGVIMLRDDSAMNFSPAMFEEFIEPYDQHLLNHFGGGAIHFCGKGDHYIHRLSQMEGVYAIALSQPEYNNMEVIFRNTVDKGIQLIGLQRQAAEFALKTGRDLHGNVHCE